MKKSVIFLGVVALIASILIGIFVFPRQLVINISQVQIQSKIETEFPLEKDLLFLKAQLKNPVIDLDQNTERVTLDIDTEVHLKPSVVSVELPGMVSLSSGISYASEMGTIYLDDIKIERIELEPLPKPAIDKVTDIVNAISIDVIESVPIYTLKADKFEQRSIKWILKDVAIADQELVVTLGR